MKTIDSRKTKMPTEVVIIFAVDQVGSRYDPATTMAIIAKEGSMPSADTIQFGNTVFLAHRGKGDNYDKMVGRAFNIDTTRNFIENCLQYLEYLRKKGITHYTVLFSGEQVFKLLRVLEKVINTRTDSTSFIREAKKSNVKKSVEKYAGFIKFGNDSIPGSI